MKCQCGQRHPRGANYYVTVIDGPEIGYLLGPYKTHIEALEKVDWATNKAHEVNRKSVFFSFGTVAILSKYKKPGLFNKDFKNEKL